eukprot:comp20840_c0_seq1/m.27541 comp20840_c0_seq1/g.27541  ORF comp20840_c0_seq1/g.27541 comp20840_c0_seq1/m.27541 type:complete len:239 (-) comp20840_c0_seq1:156-872(-)
MYIPVKLLSLPSRWTSAFQAEVRESRVDRTRQLAEAIAKAKTPPKTFISTSGVGFYKPSETAVYTEESAGGDFDFMSRLCSDWEASARLPPNTATRQVVMRLGVVLGRDRGAYPQMRFPFLFGVGGVTGSGKQFFPWIHEQDVAGLFVHALTGSNITGPLNVVAPDPITNSQFCSTVASVMGRPNLFWVPGFVFNTLLGPDRAVMLLEGQNVQPKKALDTGYVFKYPTLKEAITDLED